MLNVAGHDAMCVPDTCMLKYCTLSVSSQHFSVVWQRASTAVWDTITYLTGVFSRFNGSLADRAPQPDRGSKLMSPPSENSANVGRLVTVLKHLVSGNAALIGTGNSVTSIPGCCHTRSSVIAHRLPLIFLLVVVLTFYMIIKNHILLNFIASTGTISTTCWTRCFNHIANALTLNIGSCRKLLIRLPGFRECQRQNTYACSGAHPQRFVV